MNLWLWPRNEKPVRTALVTLSTLCSGHGHWGETYKSSGIGPRTRLESSNSLSPFLTGTASYQFLQNLITKFQGNVFVSMHDFIPQMAHSTYSFTQSHGAAAQPVSQQKLNSHCRGNGTVTDANVPCADFPSQSMVSNWRPSRQEAILPTLGPLPPMERGFFQ